MTTKLNSSAQIIHQCPKYPNRPTAQLEVFVERKALLDGIVVSGTDSLVDTRFGVCRDSRLEKVGLALEGDHLHKVEGVGRVPNLLVTQSNKKTVGDKLNVLAHELGIHTDKRDGESV